MTEANYRQAIAGYIRANAKPPDKFSHQPRLYHLAKRLLQLESARRVRATACENLESVSGRR